MRKKMVAQVIKNKRFAKVIQINCPAVFFVPKDGTPLGIYWDMPCNITDYQRTLIRRIENILNVALNIDGECDEELTPLPAYLKKEFPNEFDDKQSV